MKKYNYLSCIAFSALLLFSVFAIAQNPHSFQELKGKIIDSKTNKPLMFADITIVGTNISTISNTEGEFVLKVPDKLKGKMVSISYLGYKKATLPVSNIKTTKTISLTPVYIELTEVTVSTPKNAETLVRAALKKKGENYFTDTTVMTAFYRETIKKRKKNASLSEAVVKIYKQPYTTNKRDAIKLVKARKKTNYSRLDTIAIKLQGGPFSTLFADIIKYPEFIFNEYNLSEYDFSFDSTTQINEKLVYVVNFKQKAKINYPLYFGKLFIDAETKALTSAIYSLNVENRKMASELFVKKKPRKAKVYPVEANYRVNYRTNNGKWYYGYSNILLTFKVDWKGKLFNSVYTLNSEMAITDWELNTYKFKPSKNDIVLRPTTILTDQASGFSDPKFWGEYNIIEPEKSIESAIKKISKKLKKEKA